jgi:hypothetical protein
MKSDTPMDKVTVKPASTMMGSDKPKEIVIEKPTIPLDKVVEKPAAPTAKPPVIITKVDPPGKVSTQTPAVGDWRQSWGHADTPKTVEVVKNTSSTTTPEKVPHADVSKPDPLKQPEVYTKVATVPALTQPGSTASSGAPGDRLQPRPALQPIPPGMVSVMAARDPELSQPSGNGFGSPSVARAPAGMHVVSLPANDNNAFSEPAPKLPPTMVANAFHGDSPTPTGANGMPGPGAPQVVQLPPPPPPMMPIMPVNMQAATPTGMGNAFTEATTGRPIPENFGARQVASNAFEDPSPGMPAPVAVRPAVPALPRGSVPQGTGTASVARGSLSSSASASVPQLVSTLRGALMPSQRESAAQHLAVQDWHAHPEVVDALLTAAHEDPAASVRAESIRSLVRMKVETVAVVSVLQTLKADTDAVVRQEAEQGLATLMSPGTPRVDSSVRPAANRE